MALFSSDNPKEKQHSGILGAVSVDVIKWEPATDAEASVLAHKFEYEDFPNGSFLIVGPSQMAIFTNNMASAVSSDDDGAGLSQVSVFQGPCKIKLETGDSRFAPFRNIAHALTGGESAFHSTVYFLNTTIMNELSWGTQAPVVVVDPEEEVNVHVRAFGLFGAHIEHDDPVRAELHAQRFLRRVVGTRADYTRNELINFMRAKILEYVPQLLADYIINKKISVLKLSAYLSEFSVTIHEQLIQHFEDVGLTLDNFSFHNINVPESDLQALNEMKIKRKRDQLEAEGNAMKMDIESAARARMREREGYTYQQEQAYQVMHAAAENEGTASTFMGAGMGVGMGLGVGGAMGAGMAGIANQAMGQFGMNTQGFQSQVPPAAAKSTGEKICPACHSVSPANAKFCLNCGTKFVSEEIHCPNCGETLPRNAKFCLSCGFKIQPPAMRCPNCGAELVPGSKFCLECGTKI